MKAILVLDKMPINCFECPFHDWDKNGLGIIMCSIKTEETNCKQRPTWCPLRPLPNKQEYLYFPCNEYIQALNEGYNKCREDLLGEE